MLVLSPDSPELNDKDKGSDFGGVSSFRDD